MAFTLEDLESSVLYSEDLEIDLVKGSDAELFKWFLASILFGARISETIAKNTYQAFARHRLLTPRRILDAGWDFLVDPIMREGGYVRYDGRKSEQILRDCEQLTNAYRGSLTKLHASAKDSHDLEKKLLNFFGIGPVTVNVFLRELRPTWRHADPAPLPVVQSLAESLGFDLAAYDRKSMAFTRIEAGLFRARKQLKKTPRSRTAPAAA